jgi:hypothetical protein
MEWLNYRHLLYFWVVVREGGLVPAGKVVHRYADEIFSPGRELVETVKGRPTGQALRFRVGVADVVPKLLVLRLLRPALALPEGIRLVCQEDSLQNLLEGLASHSLDRVLSDSPLLLPLENVTCDARSTTGSLERGSSPASWESSKTARCSRPSAARAAGGPCLRRRVRPAAAFRRGPAVPGLRQLRSGFVEVKCDSCRELTLVAFSCDLRPRPPPHLRERAPHARGEPRLGAEAARPLRPEDHRAALRPPAARVHELGGEPASVRAGGPGAIWWRVARFRWLSQADGHTWVTVGDAAKRRGRNPFGFPRDSGLICGGEYGTRTRGLRRDRPAL